MLGNSTVFPEPPRAQPVVTVQVSGEVTARTVYITQRNGPAFPGRELLADLDYFVYKREKECCQPDSINIYNQMGQLLYTWRINFFL